MQGREDWRPVVSSRTTSHQCVGTESRYVCSPGICEGPTECPCPSKDGQHIGPGICQSNGGNSFPRLDESGLRDVGLVSSERNHPFGFSSTRPEQPGGRPGVQRGAILSRVETQGGVIPQDLYTPGSVQDRSVCNSTEQPAGQVHQLETRPGCHAYRCFSDQLEGPGGVCIPSLRSNRQMPTEDQSRTEYNCVSGTGMAEPSMVSNVIGLSSGTSPSPPSLLEPVVRPQGATTPPSVLQQVEASRMESIRRQHSAAGVSGDTSALLLAGWSRGTNSTYQTGWKRWSSWCQGRKADPVSCGVQPFLEFITSLFKEGLEYRTINLMRSAVSSVHETIDGTPIGQHPLVKQLFRGVYNSRPPQPRYTSTWDVNLVLDHIT